jgi:hypothetical protein
VNVDPAVQVRPATADDWPQIWPLVQAVARAGDTYAYEPDLGEAEARACWLVEPPRATAVVETNTAAVRLWTDLGFVVDGTVPGAFRHPTRGYVGLHVMYLPLAR